jgi:signal transduction histidine kinase
VELCGEQAVADRDTPVDAPVVARARPARLAPVAVQQDLWALWLGTDNGALNPTRRHLEDRERLLFTSHSLAVGEMATTLAHELNQPLGAVGNVLRGLKARLASAGESLQPQMLPPLTQGVQLALEQVQYAARVIGRVRDYTRNHQPQREPLDTLTLLRSSLALLDWDLERHGVQWSVQEDGIEQTLQQRGWAVVADGVMVQQVLVNLLRNAIDAMATSPAHERRLEVVCRIDEVDQMLEMAIRDSGCGMEDETAAQLFMPFFSTKPTGMGVGLNICRSLIELHQGRLWFTPNTDRGCTFFVALPLVATQDTQDTQELAADRA